MGAANGRRIPEATVARLPEYLRLLTESLDAGIANVSSEELADLAGVNAAKVRKDLSYLGTYGVRGVGYDVEYLVYQVRRELGLDHDWPVVIVGAGNLGQALAGYGGFRDRGFPVAGVVDVDDMKIGTMVGGIEVRPLADLLDIVRRAHVSIGVVATPPGAAQEAADRLVPSASRASSTSPRCCSPCRRPWWCARSTWRSSCRSSATTSSGGRVPNARA